MCPSDCSTLQGTPLGKSWLEEALGVGVCGSPKAAAKSRGSSRAGSPLPEEPSYEEMQRENERSCLNSTLIEP